MTFEQIISLIENNTYYWWGFYPDRNIPTDKKIKREYWQLPDKVKISEDVQKRLWNIGYVLISWTSYPFSGIATKTWVPHSGNPKIHSL